MLSSFGFITDIISKRLEVVKKEDQPKVKLERQLFSKLQKNVGIFDPKETDPHRWLQAWILVCSTEELTSYSSIVLAIRCLRGGALEWLKSVYLSAKKLDQTKKVGLVFNNSAAFETLFRNRWMKANKKSAFRKISTMRRENGETFNQFGSRIKKVFYEASISDIELMVDTFVMGLSNKLGKMIAACRPHTLDKAVQYAREYEKSWNSEPTTDKNVTYVRNRNQNNNRSRYPTRYQPQYQLQPFRRQFRRRRRQI